MPQANQNSDLLFDFGPRGHDPKQPSLDWVPTDHPAFDSQIRDPLPTFDLASTDPLPAAESPRGAGVANPDSAAAPHEFWLDGGVLMCSCPECMAPMTVRLWLMVADCWNCGISIELSEEQIRDAERLMSRQASELSRPTPPAPAAPTETRRPAPQPAPQPSPSRRPATPQPAPSKPAAPQPPIARARPPAPSPPTRPPPATPAMARPAASPVRRSSPPLPGAAPRRAPSQVHDDDPYDILRALFRDLPAWLISFIIHLALLMLLALIQRPVEEDGEEITLSATISSVVQEGGDVVQFAQTPEAKFDLPIPAQDDIADPKKREALLVANQDARELRIDPNAVESALPNLAVVKQRLRSAEGIQNGLVARDPRLRVEMVRKEGGTTLTEAAVARALRWLQRHQSPDGHWSLEGFRGAGQCNCGHPGHLNDDTAATSLALLPYLGAGQSHLVGVYKDEVASGLRWLIRHQKPDGDLRVTSSNSGMYAHGQATIVLCEAFAITGDEELRGPAQKAVDFIVEAQYNDGGWRYTPKPASQAGDTSVVGWQLMALQSARTANLTVPERTFSRASNFLDRVQHRDGAQYSYQQNSGPTPVMSAEGLLCRLYLGWNKSDVGLNEGVRYLLREHPPRRDGLGIYYWYYATQTLHHYGGEEWDVWNRQMRDILVESQQTEGHAAGSWAPVGQHSDAGGRLYMTSLAACTLEVYYRHLPVFRQIKVE
jgi:hypothetical protein